MTMILANWPLLCTPPAANSINRSSWLQNVSILQSSSSVSLPITTISAHRCCINNKDENTATTSLEEFSVLKPDNGIDNGNLWSTMALYMFSLHIPLSFGGLSVVASILGQSSLDPQTEAVCLLGIQILELQAVLWGSTYFMKNKTPLFDLLRIFQPNNNSNLSGERNWVFASIVGFGFLLLIVFSTSFLADQLTSSKEVNNHILKEIVSSGFISKGACVLVYCIITPLLEEIVYRGFLLRSLVSAIGWRGAVVVSSVVFSLAHFSVEDSLQLFIIGCILGCSYCWSGKLSSPLLIHSLYNSFILIVTFLA
ncbi:uncharacterized protein LOC124940719 [Impatiens glandulifera]|uniref:uncharacterized protein LOC124940719 n=1 Tax=Impatiens glandulifera TaxID=253017 RepID=UPI001FB05CA2|nr:uncharacterized protein LOC124940719 [Impatiens glandulifera]